MWHTFKHFIHMQYFLLPTNFVIVFVHWVSTGMLYEPRQCSFGTIFPNLNIVFASICAARPIHIQSDQYRSCLTVNNVTTLRGRRAVRGVLLRGATPGIHPDGEQPKTALWLCEITWYLYTKGMRGRMKAKQRWFKVTRELCHEWIHHFRHHVQDGHWTGEFAIIIRRLHCFTGSFRVDVRGESGPR